MKVAILNVFPNLSYSAEREFIRRCIAVLDKMGHQGFCVVTSDDIIHCDPDVVLITHEFAAKLTDHFTVGFLWSPTHGYRDAHDRIKAIRSWDLVVPINETTRHFAKDIHFPMRHLSAVSDVDFFPSAPILDVPVPDASKLSLAYVGAHWDGLRHNNLLSALAEVVDLHVYGPPNAWKHMPNQYRGSLPFDGESVTRALNQHGAVLAIHSAAHAEDGTPSMRVFEACAAKCLVFTEPMPKLLETFADSLNYLDLNSEPHTIARNVKATLDKFKNAPSLFADAIRKMESVFQSTMCLEQCLSTLLKDIEQRRTSLSVKAAEKITGFDITVIIRCGSRPLSMIQRAVASLQKQSYQRIGIVFARYAEIEGFTNWLSELEKSGRFLFLKDIRTRGGGIRSIAMWAGMRAVDTELFCMLDDDDELFSTHFSELVDVLRKDPDVDFVYSGAIRQEEDGVFINDHDRFKGDLNENIPERRILQFFSEFNLDRLLKGDNFILSHSWLARSRVLTPDVLDDPEMEVAEDVYLYLLLASRFQFRFSGTASVIWNWRSSAVENSMTAVSRKAWGDANIRLQRRLAQITFPATLLGREVVPHGLNGRAVEATEFRLPSAPLTMREKVKNLAFMRKTERFWRPLWRLIKTFRA